jgi:tetratricopeptide (TPR) repeat protein
VSTKLTQAIDAKRAEFRPEAVKAELSRLFRGPVPMYAATDLPVSLESLATLRKHRDWAKLGQYSTTLRKYMEHKSKEWSVGDKLSLAYFSALSLLLTGKLAECQRMLEFMFGLGSIKQLVHVLNDKEIIQDHFVFSNLCLLYGDLLVKLKQRGSALQFYFGVLHQYKLLNAKTQNAHVHVSRNVALAVATLFADEQDWPNALNMLSQVLSWYPDDPQHSFTVWSKLGHIHAQLGDVVQTTQCFTNAVESFSGEEWAAKQADSTSYYALQDVYNRAMLRVLQGEYNRAHVLVTPCLMHFQAIKPGHESYGVLTSLMNLLALCAVHNNSVDEAIDALERVVAKFPMYRLDTRVTSNLRVLYQLASDNYKIKHVMLDVLEFMYP